MANYDSITKAWTTGTIIAIVVGSVGSLLVCIAVTIAIICIVKRMKRSNHIRAQGMIIQPMQPYSNFQTWPNQYPPMPPPYTTTVPNYYR